MRKLFRAILLLFVIFAISPTSEAASPKYIFYFIGDGMGFGHVQTTEYFCRFGQNAETPDSLIFLTFPVSSSLQTYSANNLMTCSSAAGTALACGTKTNNTFLGVGPEGEHLTSIAEQLRDKGMKIGIITTVAPDDATPGAFYAHQPSRKLFYQIGKDAAESNFDFIGGAGLREPNNKNNPSDINLFTYFSDKGYTLCRGIDGYEQSGKNADKILLLQADSSKTSSLGYTMDQEENSLTLPFMTKAAIGHLSKNAKKGFFLMAEGGLIDHAAHINDAGCMVQEILSFNESLKAAYEFYKKHPKETLIIVTADHETGGLALGTVDGNNMQHLDYINYQKISKDKLAKIIKNILKENKKNSWNEMKEFLKKNFGLWDKIPVNTGEEGDLMKYFQVTFLSKTGIETQTLYAHTDQFTEAVFKLINKKAGIGWTTFSHTGNPVPFYAIGVGAENFSKPMNNKDIPAILRKLSGIK